MDDKDHVFARFKDDKPEAANRRETLSIPRRNGASGSRSVEVVHVRSGHPRRVESQSTVSDLADSDARPIRQERDDFVLPDIRFELLLLLGLDMLLLEGGVGPSMGAITVQVDRFGE